MIYFQRENKTLKEASMKKALIVVACAIAFVSMVPAQTINVLFWDDAYPRTLMEKIP